MSLNRTKQEEIENYEAELIAALTANSYINEYEKINLIGNQKYGKPELPEDNGLCEHSNAS